MEHITDPFDYLNNNPGKDFRHQLIIEFAQSLDASEYGEQVAQIISSLHTVSLLLDDFEDSSVLRRGQPAAHRIFGPARTVNSATYKMLEIISSANEVIQGSGDLILNELMDIHIGQGQELYWRDNFICPTLDEYIHMVSQKTSGLLKLAVKLLLLVSSNPIEGAVEIADLIGIGYQIMDDYSNICTYTNSKGFAEDITEGKYSYPVIMGLTVQNNDSRLISEVLKLRTSDEAMKVQVVEALKRQGSLSRAKVKGLHYLNLAKELAQGQDIKSGAIDMLIEFFSKN